MATVAVLAVAGLVIKAALPDGGGGHGPTPSPSVGSESSEPTESPSRSTEEPSPTHSPPPVESREKLIDAQPFALRAPAEPDVVGVDLDEPKVNDPDEFTTSEDELQLSEVSGGDWEFRTTTGISAGTTFEQCRQGLQGNALPSRIDAKDLSRQRTIRVGTVLCTETSEGNLAMLKVTRITPSAESDLPDVSTELTLWQNA
ncbi:hypothetical protein [Streptomyces sp. CA-132043]|uniref:hypothetical protein n=1 Tax=Streptomyces sp. CA-132043 TaxID=3240048 RepID=UPI003D94A97F